MAEQKLDEFTHGRIHESQVINAIKFYDEVHSNYKDSLLFLHRFKKIKENKELEKIIFLIDEQKKYYDDELEILLSL